jgi:uncharacterized protein YoxC
MNDWVPETGEIVWILVQILGIATVVWRIVLWGVHQKVEQVRREIQTAKADVEKQINGMSATRLKPTEMNVNQLITDITHVKGELREMRENTYARFFGVAEKLARLDERSRGR